MSRATGGDNYFSVCTYRTEALIVTGSMVESMSRTCQHYQIAKDQWSYLPSLIQGRSTHASCTFAARYVMVFGGIDKQYRPMNSIEKFDMNFHRTANASWELMTFKSTVLPEMQNSRMVQVNYEEICIFARNGYCYYFDVNDNSVT